ncbi:MAG: hypothetical protein FWG64_11100 [Firmicutes bacterium]|nr:hypothetical protein [Bacillota bacterium]
MNKYSQTFIEDDFDLAKARKSIRKLPKQKKSMGAKQKRVALFVVRTIIFFAALIFAIALYTMLNEFILYIQFG